MMRRRQRWVLAGSLIASVAFVASACGSSGGDSESTTTTGAATTTGGDTATTAASTDTTAAASPDTTAGAAGGTLVFGTSNDPRILDPALASDGESLRVSSQIFETLVTNKPGTTEVIPGLAKSWTATPDGLEWTFKLQEGVTFHDGEKFNAEAVCFNFDRWFNFTGPLQLSSASYYWQVIFGGYKTKDPNSDAPETSLYKSCEAVDENTVKLTLTSPNAAFLSGLVLAPFSIASPKALVEFKADEATLDSDGNPVPQGTFGTEHPVGTGPFKFDSWIRNDKLTVSRNDNYWGDKAKLDKVIFRPIPDNAARLQALQTGEIDGYDLVDPQDIGTVKDDKDLQLLERPAFNVGYVGFTQSFPPLDNPKVREALAYGMNRQAVIDNIYGGLGEVATQFQPPSLFGWADDVKKYDFDPEKAKALLAEAGVETPVKLDFWYPSNVARPYMPDPKRIAEAFASDLNQSGFDISLKSAPWSPDYLDIALSGKGALHLLGNTGDFGDPDTFLGTFFREKRPEWSFDNPELFAKLQGALKITDQAERTKAYEDANRMIMEFLPGLPYAHSLSALAFKAGVNGFVPSPVSTESFAVVTK